LSIDEMLIFHDVAHYISPPISYFYGIEFTIHKELKDHLPFRTQLIRMIVPMQPGNGTIQKGLG
jgi:hypothetical protein